MQSLIKKTFFLFLFVLFIFSNNAFAQDSAVETVDIYLFYKETCPHCHAEQEFLNKFIESNSRIRLNKFEVTEDKDNRELLEKVIDRFDISNSSVGVPLTVIGDKYFIGWLNENTTGEQMKEVINDYFEAGDHSDVVGTLSNLSTNYEQLGGQQQIADSIEVPIFGEINLKTVSLPVFTFIIAFLDGFNPCAMWTLIFLISLLLNMKDRKKMWILGMAFIGSSALVYFLFLTAWFNLVKIVGLESILRTLIGLVAVVAGFYNLKKYATQPAGVCNVTSGEKTQKVFDRLKVLVQEKTFFIALVGIIVLAFVVNLVELACSAGFPAIYTQVLSLSDLPTYQYYLYLIFYIFIFMLDDMIVFFIAMTTLKVSGVNAKYSKISELVGGVIMLIIGALLILRPDLLSFGF